MAPVRRRQAGAARQDDEHAGGAEPALRPALPSDILTADLRAAVAADIVCYVKRVPFDTHDGASEYPGQSAPMLRPTQPVHPQRRRCFIGATRGARARLPKTVVLPWRRRACCGTIRGSLIMERHREPAGLPASFRPTIAGADGSRWASRTSNPLAPALRSGRWVRFPRAPAIRARGRRPRARFVLRDPQSPRCRPTPARGQPVSRSPLRTAGT